MEVLILHPKSRIGMTPLTPKTASFTRPIPPPGLLLGSRHPPTMSIQRREAPEMIATSLGDSHSPKVGEASMFKSRRLGTELFRSRLFHPADAMMIMHPHPS